MDTQKEKEIVTRLEALEANSDKQLQTLENTVTLMGQVLEVQGRLLLWAMGRGFEKEVKGA